MNDILKASTTARYCITGGIGAGKSYVCNIMRRRGIDIYDCDRGAKRLMLEDAILRQQLTALIGPQTYNADGSLNKSAVTRYLLQGEEHKQRINAIVHPAVIRDFYASGLQWMESAILYEAHLEHTVDHVVAVAASEDVRIQRVMQRDHLPQEKAAEWVHGQTDQQMVCQRADYVIINDGEADLEQQVTRMLRAFGLTDNNTK